MYMDTFRIIVLSIAAIVLILLLVFIGILLSKGKTDVAWPPTNNTCPDYWLVTEDGSGCKIPGNLGANSLNVGTMYGNLPSDLPGHGQPLSTTFINYNNPKAYVEDPSGDLIDLQKFSGVCQQQCWSKQFNVVWDGVSNYNNCTSSC
jgi:hypothetical protein